MNTILSKQQLLFSVLMFVSSIGTAQVSAVFDNHNRQLSVHAGIAVPTGNFGTNIVEGTYSLGYREGLLLGRASTGFLIGADYLLPFYSSDLCLYISADIMYNSTKNKTEEYLEGIKSSYSNQNYSIDYNLKASNHLSIPLLGGLRYAYPINDHVTLSANVGIGMAILRRSEYSASLYIHEHNSTAIYSTAKSVTEAKLQAKLGYELGGGLSLNNYYRLNVSYMGLGSPRYRVRNTSESPSSSTQNSGWATLTKMNVFNISLGVPLIVFDR